MDKITSSNCDPRACPFCVDDICTFECASSSFKDYLIGVSLDEKELNNIFDSSKMEQKGEYYE